MTPFPAPRTRRRGGFTLIELLIVIAIIGVLIAITVSAVFKVLGKGDELRARKDISDLALAIENFKTYFKVDYIPSRFRLREDLYGYQLGIAGQDPIDADSWAYLKKLFPKLPTPQAAYPSPGSVWIDWNNNGTPDGSVDLEGHQCLVFFLGGTPSYGPNTCLGFSTSPAAPAPAVIVPPVGAPQPIGLTSERIGPFYNDFKPDRLIVLPTPSLAGGIVNGTQANGAGYFSYMDAFAKESDFNVTNLAAGKTPVYAYLSSNKKNNGYNRYLVYYASKGVLAPQQTDCPSLVVANYGASGTPGPTTQGLWPYAQSLGTAPQYLNPNTFQILCAGNDKVFGPGTVMLISNNVYTTVTSVWTPQTTGQVSQQGQDDYSNFHDRPLGTGD